MDKYYVRCGEFEYLGVAEDEYQAAHQAILFALANIHDESLKTDHFIYVDPRGFRGPTVPGGTITTEDLPEYTLLLEDVLDSI